MLIVLCLPGNLTHSSTVGQSGVTVQGTYNCSHHAYYITLIVPITMHAMQVQKNLDHSTRQGKPQLKLSRNARQSHVEIEDYSVMYLDRVTCIHALSLNFHQGRGSCALQIVSVLNSLQCVNSQTKVKPMHIPSSTLECNSNTACTLAVGAC